MRNLRNYWSVLLFFVVAFLTVSCSNNDEIKVDPNANFDVILKVTDTNSTPDTTITVDPSTLSITAKVSFSSSTDMKRLYITQNSNGKGEEIYKPIESVDLKADKSVDLTGKNANAFEFQFELPVADLGTNGTIVYKFWTTTGNGDFRNVDKRLAIGAGTITIKAGSGANPDAAVKSYTDVTLEAPLASGTSKTFVSLFDGKTYNVSAGIEYVSLWDFGYLYSVSAGDGATLRAPYNYNVPYYPGSLANPVIDIPAKSGTTNGDLNKTYFQSSSKTGSEFDAISNSAELNYISITKSDDNVRITNLEVGNVIEFIDNYDKKGLIKVLEISGTNGEGDFISIAIKVQP